MSVKQVIVMRKDLKMRRGKEISQGAHASMAWLTTKIREVNPSGVGEPFPFTRTLEGKKGDYITTDLMLFSAAEREWIVGIFTKVCLQVDSEAELDAVAESARAAGLTCHVIEDAGLTEFNGVKTKTCCAIGPDEAEKIDAVTGKLRLY